MISAINQVLHVKAGFLWGSFGTEVLLQGHKLLAQDLSATIMLSQDIERP
jgi:hypothetical protein